LRFAAPRGEAAVSLEDILEICRPLLPAGAGAFSSLTSEAVDDGQAKPIPGLSFGAIDSPEEAGPDSITFVGPRTPLRVREALIAGMVLIEPGAAWPVTRAQRGIPVLRVTSIHAAMAALLTALEPRLLRPIPFPAGPGNRIAPTAVVEGCLEGDVDVGPGAYIAKGAYIGSGSRIEAHAVIREHCVIGRGCVIQPGAVIGCAGFGFFPAPASDDVSASGAVSGKAAVTSPSLLAMPHLAGVIVGDECWVGANAVVAAGVLGPTTLGRGCKLDSHVQIAHNVRLGDGCLLASQSGIAGSTVAGHRLRMGGASSVDGHLRIGNDVSIAACSGVTKDLADGAIVAGFPARPIREWRRQQITLKRMGGMDVGGDGAP
jgi:UDP-3-O-[3-hydroxymyristoyl] glucosamine N-acyltransferase